MTAMTAPNPRLTETAPRLARARMTATDRLAAVAYKADLSRQFHENARSMWRAKTAGSLSIYRTCVETSRALYREIEEVSHALASGFMPF